MSMESSNLKQGVGYAVRASLYAAAPTYLLTRGINFSDRVIQAIAVVYGPSMLILGVGVIEGTVRTIVHLALAFVQNENRKKNLEAASIELQTAHKLLRGAIMPISGYSIIAVEVYRYVHYYQGDRSLINDYYAYHTPLILLKHTYTHILVPVYNVTRKVIIVFAKTTHRFVLKPVWKYTENSFRFGYNVLDAMEFWTGLATAASYGASLINAGVGFAVNALGNRSK